MIESRRTFLASLAGMAISTAVAREVLAATARLSYLDGPVPELKKGDDLVYAPLSAQLRWLRAKKITSEELLKAYLDRIEKIDHLHSMNTFVTLDREAALARARELDRLAAGGKFAGGLHGLPIAVKDDICTKDMPTTAGSFALKGWRPKEDAFVVQCLRNAGAVIIGKTNLNEFTLGATGRNLHFGQVRNPHALGRMPGGSSAGSAAATASAFCAAALGSDSSGSVRAPAANCGVVGFRPTRGLVSKTGLIANSPTKEVIGVLARSVEDAAIITNTLAERDPSDPLTKDAEGWDWPDLTRTDLKGLRFAHLADYTRRSDKSIRDVTEKAVARIRELGGEVTELESPEFELLKDAADTIHYGEARAWVQLAIENAGRSYDKAGKEIDPAIQFSLSFFEQIPSAKFCRHLEWTRPKLINEYTALLRKHDFLILPMQTLTPPPAEKGPPASDAEKKKRKELYATLRENGEIAGVCGFPAITVPSGFGAEGLPVGLQLIAKPFDDRRLFEAAAAFEAKSGAFRRPGFGTA